jgi:restriction endonuclease S subunit
LAGLIEMAISNTVPISRLYGAARLDAECYTPEMIDGYQRLSRLSVERLGDHAFITDGQHGYHEVDPDSPVRHLTAKCIRESFIDDADADRLSIHIHGRNMRSNCEAGDVLLSTAGTLGNAGIVTDDVLPANMDQDVARIHLQSQIVDPWYLTVFLNSRLGKLQSARLATGQVQQHIALEKIREFQIPTNLPQEKIGNILKRAFEQRQLARALTAEAEEILTAALDIARVRKQALFFSARLPSESRIDAQYFQPHFQQLLKQLRRGGGTIADVARLSRRRFRPKAGISFHYIEIGDVSKDGFASWTEIEGAEAPSRATWVVRPGDVITSLVRPIRRLTALITEEQSGFVCSSGFGVLRPLELPGEVLLTFLRLPLIAELLDLFTTASMYPAISVTNLMEIPFSRPSTSVVERVEELIRDARKAHREFTKLVSRSGQLLESELTQAS